MDVDDKLAPPDTTNTLTTANNFVATKSQKIYMKWHVASVIIHP